MADDGTQYPVEDIGNVYILNDRIYDHKTLRLNYSTYDMRRDYDIVGISKHSNVMTVSKTFDPTSHSSEDGHPFAYARILGIYHADIIHTIPGSRNSTAHSMEFLFVQWYRLDHQYKAGFQHRRFHRITLVSPDTDDAYGFLDPDDVIRGSHLIPAFAHGKVEPRTPMTSLSNTPATMDDQWLFYYVNWYVPRVLSSYPTNFRQLC